MSPLQFVVPVESSRSLLALTRGIAIRKLDIGASAGPTWAAPNRFLHQTPPGLASLILFQRQDRPVQLACDSVLPSTSNVPRHLAPGAGAESIPGTWQCPA